MAEFHLIPVNTTVKLSAHLKADAIVIFRSTRLQPSSTSRTALNLLADNNNIVLHMGFRYDENAISFMVHDGSGWQHEEKIPFGDRLRGQNPSVTVIDHGDRYQILFNGITGHYYQKRINAPAVSLQYNVDNNHQSLVSNPIVAEIYPNLAAIRPGLG